MKNFPKLEAFTSRAYILFLESKSTYSKPNKQPLCKPQKEFFLQLPKKLPKKQLKTTKNHQKTSKNHQKNRPKPTKNHPKPTKTSRNHSKNQHHLYKQTPPSSQDSPTSLGSPDWRGAGWAARSSETPRSSCAGRTRRKSAESPPSWRCAFQGWWMFFGAKKW